MAQDGSATGARTGRPVWRRIIGSTWFQVVVAFVVIGLVLSFVAKPFRVPSESMEQTLRPGDFVLVNRLAYHGSSPESGPKTGDVVVFDADQTWGAYHPSTNPIRRGLRSVLSATGYGPTGYHTLVKRVVAGPGQTVSCCSPTGAVIVDGKPLDEPYVFDNLSFTPGTLDCTTTPRSTRCLPEVRVPEGDYLVLGDNRGNSSDSAINCRTGSASPDSCYRWAKRDDIVGKVVAVVWPPTRWHATP